MFSDERSDPKNICTLSDKHMEADPSNSNNDDNINVDEKRASTQRVCNMSGIIFNFVNCFRWYN